MLGANFKKIAVGAFVALILFYSLPRIVESLRQQKQFRAMLVEYSAALSHKDYARAYGFLTQDLKAVTTLDPAEDGRNANGWKPA
jgi:hypothetical protein